MAFPSQHNLHRSRGKCNRKALCFTFSLCIPWNLSSLGYFWKMLKEEKSSMHRWRLKGWLNTMKPPTQACQRADGEDVPQAYDRAWERSCGAMLCLSRIHAYLALILPLVAAEGHQSPPLDAAISSFLRGDEPFDNMSRDVFHSFHILFRFRPLLQSFAVEGARHSV